MTSSAEAREAAPDRFPPRDRCVARFTAIDGNTAMNANVQALIEKIQTLSPERLGEV